MSLEGRAYFSIREQDPLKHGLKLAFNNNTGQYAFFEVSSTFKLLLSSILVAFSGAWRVRIASLLLQTNGDALTCVASGLIIYSVYILDRALESKEDSINLAELDGSNKKVGLLFSLITFSIGSFIFFKEGLIALAFLPFVTGFLYSKGIKVGGHTLKLKGSLGMKNLIVGLTWGTSIVFVAGKGCVNTLPFIFVFLFFGVKLFINSVIYDFKDVKGDLIAGIKTLPVSLGPSKTRELLTVLHVVSHTVIGAALLFGFIAFEPVMVAYSFLCGFACIWTKKDMKLERTLLVDGESAAMLILRAFN